jgi:hypothetical protein
LESEPDLESEPVVESELVVELSATFDVAVLDFAVLSAADGSLLGDGFVSAFAGVLWLSAAEGLSGVELFAVELFAAESLLDDAVVSAMSFDEVLVSDFPSLLDEVLDVDPPSDDFFDLESDLLESELLSDDFLAFELLSDDFVELSEEDLLSEEDFVSDELECELEAA